MHSSLSLGFTRKKKKKTHYIATIVVFYNLGELIVLLRRLDKLTEMCLPFLKPSFVNVFLERFIFIK